MEIDENGHLILEVLIETYWNVKIRGHLTKNVDFTVLIETYWNVKAVRV